MILAVLTSLALVFPQDSKPQKGDPRFTSVLTPAEQTALNGRVRALFDAEIDFNNAEAAKRESLRKKRTDALDALNKEWAAREKKGNHVLLKHLGDLRAIFQDVIGFKPQTGTGEVKPWKGKEGQTKAPFSYGVVIPKTYREKTAYRCVVLAPGFDAERKVWTPHKDWFDKTWKGSELAESSLFVLPELDKELEFDAMPDTSKESDVALEDRRVKGFLMPPFSGAHEDFRLDLDRVVLDCGKGTSAFGLRLCTYFPHRFAGLILRAPTDIGKLRVESTNGLPVLLLASAETKAACEKIAKALNDLNAGSCTVIEGKGGYPFPDSKAEIAEWTKKAQRDMFKAKVTLVPTSNKFRSGFWVRLGTITPIESTSEAERASFVVETDQKQGRITITSKNVEDFVLNLNDALVSLDKEVTVVVNGQASTVLLQRNRKKMCEPMIQQRDPTLLFTAVYERKIDKEPKKDGDAKEEPKQGGKDERP